MNEWKLGEAKDHLSEVMTRALSEGPQRITRRSEAVVVLSANEYDKLLGARPTLIDLLLNPPERGVVTVERSNETVRAVDFGDWPQPKRPSRNRRA